MGSIGEDEDWKEVESNMNKRGNEESEGRNSGSKRIRISVPAHQDSGVSEEIGSPKKEKIRNGVVGSGEKRNLNVNVTSCSGGLNSSDGEEIKLGLDLEIQGLENVASSNGGLNSPDVERIKLGLNLEIQGIRNDESVPVVTKGKVEIIDIQSCENEDDDVKIVDAKDVDPFDEMNEDEKARYLAGVLVKLATCGGSSSSRGEKVKEEPRICDSWKGKEKITDIQSDYSSSDDSFSSEDEQAENYREWRGLERRQTAIRFARSDNYSEEHKNEEKTLIEDVDDQLGKSSGPFSTALKMIKERVKRSSDWGKQLIKWEPSRKGCNVSRKHVPSLLDLSLKAASQNTEAIDSLEFVPDHLRQSLIDLLCDLRRMNVRTLKLLLKGSPTEIRLKDSTWLTEEELSIMFGNLNTKELMVFQLDLCGQLHLDYLMRNTVARFSNSLPKLAIFSLKGASRLSDHGLTTILASAPRLQSVNLSQCSLLTHVSIDHLTASLGSILKELFIKECPNIDVMLALPSLKKFERLEVLSVAGIQTVYDRFVHELMATSGQRIKELDFARCRGLTNYALKVIGDSSPNLRSLNVSNLEKLTDLGLLFLADGCRSIETLRFSHSNFSDEAIAAFLEASGESLKDLSLNNVKLVGPCTALSLAKCSRKLLSLDLSWCRKITNEALGLIVDSCSSLKQVKLFGCTQITDTFFKGHSNPEVTVIGSRFVPLLGNTSISEPHGVLLRYSPLE